MMKDIETTIYTESDFRIHIDEWDGGGIWLSMRNDSAGVHTTLTRDEAKKLLQNLQTVLEATA